jgi:5-methylcytosine-specific restriction protein B
MGAPEPILDRIAARVGDLNDAIAAHRSLGPQYRVGHSFVTPAASPGQTAQEWIQWFDEVIEREIGPLLREYWYDDGSAVEEQLAQLRNAA